MARSAALNKPIEVGRHLIRHPRYYRGELTFKGTRIQVETVLHYIAKGMSVDEALRNWPTLTHEAIEEALSMATKALIQQSEGRHESDCR